jgi:cephalosporin hydroxylase
MDRSQTLSRKARRKLIGGRERLRVLSSRTIFRLAPRAYHHWYYDNAIWRTTSWMGVPTQKSPSDMWNYQEIIWQIKPSLVVEFGTCDGGSALFFACMMRQLSKPFRVLSVDINPCGLSDRDIEFMVMSSTDNRVAARIGELRKSYPGRMFAILDSDHSKQHVLAEMIALRDVTCSGDYVIVEDSNINGHPVYGAFGPGPYEAMESYFSTYPDDYLRDTERERKFGFTFATDGFLIRR